MKDQFVFSALTTMVFNGKANGRSQFTVSDDIQDEFESDIRAHWGQQLFVVGDYEVDADDNYTLTLVRA